MKGKLDNPKIYHITHLDNIPGILKRGRLLSDAKRIEMDANCIIVGMSSIKKRRMEEIKVTCHPGTTVGMYVPFYFCHRSVMLYILHKGNHPELSYRGGQRPIVHLQADLQEVVHWCSMNTVKWAFSDRNAGAYYARFFNRTASLQRINWEAVKATDFSDPQVKDGKQAEFLVHDYFPWELVERIGVMDREIAADVQKLLDDSEYIPVVNVLPSWYY